MAAAAAVKKNSVTVDRFSVTCFLEGTERGLAWPSPSSNMQETVAKARILFSQMLHRTDEKKTVLEGSASFYDDASKQLIWSSKKPNASVAPIGRCCTLLCWREHDHSAAAAPESSKKPFFPVKEEEGDAVVLKALSENKVITLKGLVAALQNVYDVSASEVHDCVQRLDDQGKLDVKVHAKP
jgi:hypothetical protein